MTRRKPIGQRLAEEYEAYQRDLLPDVSAVVDIPGAWEVTDDEHSPGVHEFGIWANDGEYGRYVVEVIPSKADADLIVRAVNTLRAPSAEQRKRDAALKAVEALHVPSHSYCVVCDAERDVEVVGNNPRCEHRRSFCRACEIAWPCPTVQAITAALRPCEHDWMLRGSFGDEWRECFLCGEEEDVS